MAQLKVTANRLQLLEDKINTDNATLTDAINTLYEMFDLIDFEDEDGDGIDDYDETEPLIGSGFSIRQWPEEA